jgi:hypothetical protein
MEIAPTKIVCQRCGKEFLKTHYVSLYAYCSKKCSMDGKHWEDRFVDPPEIGTTGTIGAIHELRVCVDLMSKGWDAFRALSPHGPIDVVAIKGDRVIRIQVRKARETVDGKYYFGKPKDGSPHDMIALSFSTGKVVYLPPLE